MLKLFKSKKIEGFSLLELVVGVGVLSVGIVSVIQAFSFASQAQVASSDMIQAVFFAEDNLQELGYKWSDLKGSVLLKKNDKFNWECATQEAGNPPLSQINCEVSWMRKNAQEKLEVSSLFPKVENE